MTFACTAPRRRTSRVLLAACLALVAPPALAEQPATSPATEPVPTTEPTAANQPTAASQPTTRIVRTTQPATTRRATPGEIIEQMRAKQREADKLPKIGFITLDGPIVEKPQGFSLLGGGGGGDTLIGLLDRLRDARNDKDIRALVIVITANAGMSLSHAAEIRDELAEFRKAGKRTFVYADNYDTVSYTLASGASDICLLEGGEMFMPGIGFETQFFKGLMDKVGVKGDYIQIGEFKGADEAYTRTEASPQMRQEMSKLADGLFNTVTQGISRNRNLPIEIVTRMVDDAMLMAPAARDQKFIDHLTHRDALRALVEKELNAPRLNVVNDYAEGAKPEMDFSNPFAFLAQMNKKQEATKRETIAIVYAEGTIVDGVGGGGGGIPLPIPGIGDSGPSIGSEDIRKAMRQVRDDPNVKAVIIRIDSPGGSALASEVMWQSVRQTALTKPIVISIGSMAASGGYYLASAGDHIVAEPSGIVGSIGVVGGKFVLKGLYEKVGITTESFTRGKNADMYSSSVEWNDRQRRMVANTMKATYDQFTDRIMTTRRGKIADIDKVARGRIFVSAEAINLGMVDELGGIRAAIAAAAKRAELKPDEFDLRFYPEASGGLGGLGGLLGAAPSPAAPLAAYASFPEASLFKLLPADHRRAFAHHLRIISMLQDHPVVLALPFTISTPSTLR
jgi:protease IV